MLLLCCDRDVAVRNGGAAAEVIAFTAARCSPSQLKITLHHKTRRTEWREVFLPPPSSFPSIAHYPASLTKFNLFSPSFIIYTPSYLLSVHLQLEVSTSKALAPVKTFQLTASARVAKTGRASRQLNTASKSRALFLLGVLRVGVWSYPLYKTTPRSLLCTGKQGWWSVHKLLHASDRLDIGILMFSPSQKALGCLCPSAIPTLEELIIKQIGFLFSEFFFCALTVRLSSECKGFLQDFLHFSSMMMASTTECDYFSKL